MTNAAPKGKQLSEPGKIALDYALSDRWHIFPLHTATAAGCSCGKAGCGSAGKHPRTTNGLKDATTDPDQIRAWWTRWPDANIGVRTGSDTGFVMIGPDGEQGIADVAGLEQDLGPLPKTKHAKSGSGGEHYYFKWPSDGLPIKSRRNHLGTKIDVRGDGGYFVAPPSVNANGRYEWIDQEADFAELPGAWADWCRTDERKEHAAPPAGFVATASSGTTPVIDRARRYLAKMPPAVSGQRGHDALFTAARAMVWGFCLPTEDAYNLLANEYNHRCLPPWSEKEVRHKIDQAAATASNKPRGWLLNDDHDAGSSSGAGQQRAGSQAGGKAQRNGRHEPPPGAELITRTAADIKPELVSWLWPLRIPFGMLSEITGDPGDGKSTITADLAARATNGRDFPPMSGATGTPCPVLFLSAEDSASHTIRPRLGAANADLKLVEVLDCVRVGDHRGPLILPAHLELVKAKMDRMKAKLVILDPLTAFIGSDIDANSDKDVRSTLLYPLKEVAEQTGAAIVLVRHLNKGTGKAVYRGGGSIAFTGAVRVSLCTGKAEDGKRYLACVKSNVGPEAKAIEYSIDFDDNGSRVVWGPEADITGDDLIGPTPSGGRGERTEEAEEFLREVLKNGPVTVGRKETDPGSVRSSAFKRGIKWRTVELAKGKLGVRSSKGAFSGAWMWELPAAAEDVPD
jgi:archaellum biogenesis ATPase FlaH